MGPEAFLALQLALALTPQLIQAIELSKVPDLTPEQMAILQATRDKAIADYEAAIKQ